MTSLSNRPNAALVVIDVQKGVVANATRRDEVVGNISTLVDKARAEDVPVIWVQHASDDELPAGQRAVAVRRRAPAGRVRAARPQAVRRFVRGHRARVGARRAGRRPARGDRRPDRRLRPVDAARRVHPRLRHGPRRRRPHDRGPLRVGCAPARPGDLPHQPLLVLAGRRRAGRLGSSTPAASASTPSRGSSAVASRHGAHRMSLPLRQCGRCREVFPGGRDAPRGPRHRLVGMPSVPRAPHAERGGRLRRPDRRTWPGGASIGGWPNRLALEVATTV